MTLADRISDFIGKAQTRARELQLSLNGEFDYNGYQSLKSEDLLLKISETYDFIKILVDEDHGGLTDKEVNDLIDFFIKWLDLNKVIAASYQNYSMPIVGNVLVPGGSYATTAALAAEIAARIVADQALNNRINALEGFDPGAIFPADFFENYDSTYAVVFDDDERLHLHANKSALDQILATDVVNIKALVAHFASIGEPGGQHVSQEDRDRWNNDETGGGSGGSVTQAKYQLFVAPGGTSSFIVDNGTINQINFVARNGIIQPPGSYTVVGNTVGFDTNIPNGHTIQVSYFQDLSIGGGGESVYNLSSPTTIAVGGMPLGTSLTGRTWQSIIEEICVDYILPAFTLFDITDLPSTVEVGTTINGVRNFSWNTSSSANVQPNTIAIRDVTANVLIASGLANDGAEGVDIGSITNTSPITRQWRAEGVNTQAGSFVSATDSITSIYPYFYGKVASGGAAPGVSRPASNQALINSGTKVVQPSGGTISINFNSTADDYIWFAIPATATSKVSWFVNELNQGAIGGAVSAGGNLFPDFSTVSINSPTALWSGVNYKIYVSNYQTAVAAAMQMRNT